MKPNKSKPKSNRATPLTQDIMDVPNMNTFNNTDDQSIAGYSIAEQSLDSLDFMTSLMKDNLNASIRDGDGHDDFRSKFYFGDGDTEPGNGGNGNGGVGGGGDERVRDSFNSRISGNSRHSGNSNSSGGSADGSLASIQRRVKADHVDVPHFDDILRGNERTNTINADAAGGESRRGSGDGNNTMDSVSFGSADKKKSAIIIQDNERRSSPKKKRVPRHTTIEQLDMKTPSNSSKSRRASLMFESLWGNNNSNNNVVDIPEDDVISISDSNNQPMKLMRTLSGRVGFARGDTAPMYEDNCGLFGGYFGRSEGRGSNCRNSCQSYWRRHAKLVMSCVVLCIGVAATVGALVVMIPLWMRGEERMESGELGGGSVGGVVGDEYGEAGGEGGILMNGTGEQLQQEQPPVDISSGNQEEVPSNTVSNNNNEIAPATNSSPKIQAPPYNLQQICSQSSISSSQQKYDNCVLACLPSRCCLVPENNPYQVWKETVIPSSTPSQTSLPAASANSDAFLSIGTMIPSCFHSHPDVCVHYYNQCSVLGTSTLLPRKPPRKEDVESMSVSEKLELAEWINHDCTKLRSDGGSESEGESGCELLCHEKECCFANDYEENDGIRLTDNANAVETVSFPEEASTTTPTLSPTVKGSSSSSSSGGLNGTYTPTNEGSSHKPTPSGTVSNSFLRQRRRLEVVHMEIPGEEDFVYVTNPEEGEGQHQYMSQDPSLATDPSSTTASEGAASAAVVAVDQDIVDTSTTASYEPIMGELNEVPKLKVKNCVGDPQEFCTTYAGCAPFFG